MFNVCVFMTTDKNSYHTLFNTNDAMRIVLSPWTKQDLTALLKCADKTQLRERMKPFLTFLDHEAAKIRYNVVDEDRMDIHQIPWTPQQNDCGVLAYDEVSAWALVGSTDQEVDAYLEEHFLYRFDLVGGRMGHIENPSTSFADLRRRVNGYLELVSAQQLASPVSVNA